MSLRSGREVVFCMNAFENVAVKQKSSSSLANVVFKKIALEQNLSAHYLYSFSNYKPKKSSFCFIRAPSSPPLYMFATAQHFFKPTRLKQYYTTTNKNT